MDNAMSYVLAAAAFIGAGGVIWRSVLKPAAIKLVNAEQREKAWPALIRIAEMDPPLPTRLDRIEDHLESIDASLGRGKK